MPCYKDFEQDQLVDMVTYVLKTFSHGSNGHNEGWKVEPKQFQGSSWLRFIIF